MFALRYHRMHVYIVKRDRFLAYSAYMALLHITKGVFPSCAVFFPRQPKGYIPVYIDHDTIELVVILEVEKGRRNAMAGNKR